MAEINNYQIKTYKSLLIGMSHILCAHACYVQKPFELLCGAVRDLQTNHMTQIDIKTNGKNWFHM